MATLSLPGRCCWGLRLAECTAEGPFNAIRGHDRPIPFLDGQSLNVFQSLDTFSGEDTQTAPRPGPALPGKWLCDLMPVFLSNEGQWEGPGSCVPWGQSSVVQVRSRCWVWLMTMAAQRNVLPAPGWDTCQSSNGHFFKKNIYL